MIHERNIRKNNCKLFECFFKTTDIERFNHYYLKNLMYNEIKPKSITDCYIKQLYDAYNYLLVNSMSNLEERIIKRFFYIFNEIELDRNIILDLQTNFLLIDENPIEKSVSLLIDIIKIIDNLNISDNLKSFKNLIGTLFMNYCFVHYNLFCVNPFSNKKSTEYFDNFINEYIKGNKVLLTEFILQLQLNQKEKKNKQKKEYYKNLIDLNLNDIYKQTNEIKDILVNEYKVNHLYIYGSFCDNNNRFDSDIDLLCEISDDLTYQEKLKTKEKLENYLFGVFKRFIDIHMMSKYITSQMIVSMENLKKIF